MLHRELSEVQCLQPEYGAHQLESNAYGPLLPVAQQDFMLELAFCFH